MLGTCSSKSVVFCFGLVELYNVYVVLNLTYMQELPVQQRADAVSSLVYEANARVRDPVYGCVGAISYLENQVSQLQMQLAVAQTEMLCIRMQQESALPMPMPTQMQQDDKSFLAATNNLDNISQYLNFASSSSSSSSNVIQDPSALKRESLWT